MYSRSFRVPEPQCWQCPVCLRVEVNRLPDPRCPGTPEQPHRLAYADELPGSTCTPPDDRHLFTR